MVTAVMPWSRYPFCQMDVNVLKHYFTLVESEGENHMLPFLLFRSSLQVLLYTAGLQFVHWNVAFYSCLSSDLYGALLMSLYFIKLNILVSTCAGYPWNLKPWKVRLLSCSETLNKFKKQKQNKTCSMLQKLHLTHRRPGLASWLRSHESYLGTQSTS